MKERQVPKPAKQAITKKLHRAKSQNDEPVQSVHNTENSGENSEKDEGSEDSLKEFLGPRDVLSTEVPLPDFNISCLRKNFKM